MKLSTITPLELIFTAGFTIYTEITIHVEITIHTENYYSTPELLFISESLFTTGITIHEKYFLL